MANDAVGLPYRGLCWEDLTIGRRFRTISRTVTEADIMNFINCTGTTQVLFMSLDFLARGATSRAASPPARSVTPSPRDCRCKATMPHTGFAFLGMDLKIKNPLFASDTIHVEVEVIEAQLSQSRRGPVRTRNRVVGRTAPWLSPTRRCAWSSVIAPAGLEA